MRRMGGGRRRSEVGYVVQIEFAQVAGVFEVIAGLEGCAVGDASGLVWAKLFGEGVIAVHGEGDVVVVVLLLEVAGRVGCCRRGAARGRCGGCGGPDRG